MGMLRFGAGALLAAFLLPAATLQHLSLEDMTARSTAIVRARITSSSTAQQGGTIYTHYRIEATETLKGAAPAEVILPGGVAGGLRQVFPGTPKLELNKEYLLFLWTGPSGRTQVMGLSQGVMDLQKAPDGQVMVLRARSGSLMVDQAGRPMQEQPIRMRLNEMRGQVKRAVTTSAGASR